MVIGDFEWTYHNPPCHGQHAPFKAGMSTVMRQSDTVDQYLKEDSDSIGLDRFFWVG